MQLSTVEESLWTDETATLATPVAPLADRQAVAELAARAPDDGMAIWMVDPLLGRELVLGMSA